MKRSDLRMYHGLGFSDREIAKRLGCSSSSVRVARVSMGLPPCGKKNGSVKKGRTKRELLDMGRAKRRQAREESDALIGKLAESGLNDRQISAEVGMPVSTVRTSRVRAGVKSPVKAKVSQISPESVLRLYTQGLSETAIAEIYGCTRSKINHIRTRWGTA